MAKSKKIKNTQRPDETQYKLVFAPGCFDDFEGTQEELDAMVAEIRRLAESGELVVDVVGVDDLDVDQYDEILKSVGSDGHRRLH